MDSFCRKAGTLPNLALAVVLIAAQSVVSAHEFEHDPGSTQNQVCTTCIAASQIGSASIDSGTVYTVTNSTHTHVEASVSQFDTIHTLTIRQRGPPASL